MRLALYILDMIDKIVIRLLDQNARPPTGGGKAIRCHKNILLKEINRQVFIC